MEEIKTIGRGALCLNISKNIPSDKTFVKSTLDSTCLNLNIFCYETSEEKRIQDIKALALTNKSQH